MLICLHTFKWFQVLLSNNNNSICTQLNSFRYCHITQIIYLILKIPSKRLDSSICPVDRTLTSTISLGQSGPRSNGNEVVLHTFKSSKTGSSLSDAVKCHRHLFRTRKALPICRDAVSVFYSPSQQSCQICFVNSLVIYNIGFLFSEDFLWEEIKNDTEILIFIFHVIKQ